MPVLILSATPSSLAVTYDYKNTILGFVAFVALILLSYFVLRWLSNRTIGGARHLRVIERLAVSRDVSLMIVEIGSKVMAVSATKEGLRLLCELSPRDVADLRKESAPRDEDDHNSTFLKRFWHNLRIQLGFLPKDTPPARPAEQEDAPPPPSPFAMALLRAQAEDDKGALMEILNKRQQSPSLETRTDAEPVFSTANTERNSGLGGARDYNAAIESLKQMGKFEAPVVPVAPTTAAAAYKTVTVPRHEPRQNAVPEVFVEERPPEREEKIVIPPRDEKHIARGEGQLYGEGISSREEKPPSRDDKVDELFDRISKRNSRYKK